MSEKTLITTSTTLEGYRVVEQLGLVRGIIVRSRSIFGNFAGRGRYFGDFIPCALGKPQVAVRPGREADGIRAACRNSKFQFRWYLNQCRGQSFLSFSTA